MMSRGQKLENFGGVVVPLVGFVVAVYLLWGTLVGWASLAVMVFMYLFTCLGITLGYHRLLTHRSFQTRKPIEYALAIMGSLAVQGPVMTWVADHRMHHAHTDKAGDPHSPHGHGPGVRGALRGLWHAHVGWLFKSNGLAAPERYARELYEDRGMRIIHHLEGLWLLFSAAIPFGLGWLLTRTVDGALEAALWGGPVRVVALHHATFSVNSICHYFGARRFDTDDRSTNVAALALISLGDSWHHNHHTFPRSAFHGLRRWEVDPTGWIIRAMRRVGLAWNVIEIAPERQRERLAANA